MERGAPDPAPLPVRARVRPSARPAGSVPVRRLVAMNGPTGSTLREAAESPRGLTFRANGLHVAREAGLAEVGGGEVALEAQSMRWRRQL